MHKRCIIGISEPETFEWMNLTSIYKLFDTAPVVDKVGAFLDRILHHQSIRLAAGGAGVAYAASAGGATVPPTHIAPQARHCRW